MKRISSIIIAFLFLGILACEHDIPSEFSVDDLPDAPAAPANVKIQVGDRVLELSWDAVGSTSISKYFIYRSITSPDSMELLDSATTTGFTDNNVQNGIRYFYEITALSTADIEGIPSPFISAIPGVYSLAINNDDDYTSSREVTINPNAPDRTTHIMLSNSEDFTTSRWRNYANSVGWELTSGDGLKTVYARFKDQEGNETTESFSDDIILDTKAEIDSFYVENFDSPYQAGETIRFIVEATETDGSATVDLGNLGTITPFDNGTNGDATADDGIYTYSYRIPPNTELSDAVVSASFTDRAGNQAPAAVLSSTLTISNPPDAPTLSATGAGETTLGLAWISKNIGDFSQFRLYRDDDSGVNENSDLIATITSQETSTFTDEELEPSTTYYYRLFIYDNSGLSASSNEISRRTLANQSPDPVSLAIEAQDSTTVRLTWTRNNDDDFESYRIYRSNSSGVSNSPSDLMVIENSQATTNFTDDGLEIGQTYYYKIYVFDRFGASAGSNEVSAP